MAFAASAIGAAANSLGDSTGFGMSAAFGASAIGVAEVSFGAAGFSRDSRGG